MGTENQVIAEPERRYYIEQYSDEIMPCDGTLGDWAQWFSKPDPEWKRPSAAQDGDRFPTSVLCYEPDVIATRENDRWTFSREIGDAHFLAVRWAEGDGWSPDNIVWGEDMTAALLEWFTENNHLCEDREFVAIGFYEPKVVLTYRAGPPASMEVDVLQ